MNKEGLETLLALLSKSEWRACIKCIELIDPGLEALQYQKRDEYLWFGCWRVVSSQLESMIDRVSFNACVEQSGLLKASSYFYVMSQYAKSYRSGQHSANSSRNRRRAF